MHEEYESSKDHRALNKIIAGMLLTLLLSFATLAPGGPIENRDFSHLSPATFNGFNAFLITLWVVGLFTAYALWRAKPVASWAAILIGWTYVIIVALDLGKVFPVSTDSTGFLLGLIMIVDAILAVNVVLFSHKALEHI